MKEARTTDQPALWDLRCLLCSSVVGQMVEKAFVHDPNCTLEPSISQGRMRCCRCGGTLLMEAAFVRQAKTIERRTALHKHAR